MANNDAKYLADPFLIENDGTYYKFFEVVSRHKKPAGDIGYATSTDLNKWQYQGIVLDEEFHLSYPNIFKHENEHFMVPESWQDYAVNLYQAIDFPFIGRK